MIMDHMINNNKFTIHTSNSWNNLDNMVLEDHHIHHHHQQQQPLNSIPLWPLAFPLQPHIQDPPSSSLPPPPPAAVPDHRQDQELMLKHYHHQEHNLFCNSSNIQEDQEDEDEEELGAMKEMMYKIAAMQPVDIDPATIRKPKRRNVRISDDPQSVAARHRRERISEKIRILQRLVPGGTKMDTASMLDEAIRYVKFLKRQIRQLQSSNNLSPAAAPICIGAAADWPVLAPNKSATPAGGAGRMSFGGHGNR